MPETLLLVGKIAFLLLLYLFIFSVVRSSTRDLRLAAPVAAGKHWRMPGDAAEDDEDLWRVATVTAKGGVWTLAVLKSSSIPVGAAYALPDGYLTPWPVVLRTWTSSLDDTFVSAKHALFEVTDEGLWVEDLRSTNGTMVNGGPIRESTLLEVGDRVTVGDTVFEVRVR